MQRDHSRASARLWNGKALVRPNLDHRGSASSYAGRPVRVRKIDPLRLCGLRAATRGNIVFDGKPVQRLPPNKRDIAMVFQSYALYPHKRSRRTSGSRCG